MNLVLCWKELREHWLVWLTIAMLALLLIGGAALMFSPGGLIAPDQELVRTMAMVGASVLAVTYGLVCGSIMLAAEAESGTQVFLDLLTARRAPVWAVKLAVGCGLALAQGAVLFAISSLGGVVPDVTNPRESDLTWFWWAWILLMLTLDAFAWGLYASALCRAALTAVGVALGLWFLSWIISALLFPLAGVNPAFTQTLLAGGAILVSRRVYCQPDRERRPSPEPALRFRVPALPGWRPLLWLALRQGSWLIAVLALVGVLLGLLIPFTVLLLWPAVGLAVGILCGVEVFAGDQGGYTYRLLGSLRLPPGLVWGVRVLCWLGITALLCAVVWLGVGLHQAVDQVRETSQRDRGGDELGLEITLRGVFLVLWPLYGFAVGQTCALFCRKPVIAVLLALLLSAATVAIWVPSLLGGGLRLWQVLAVPLLLLAATRLSTWAWFGDRLYTRRPVLTLAACCLLALAWVALMLWYRVAEVPDVGEPFDVPAFLASLPPPEKNEAGTLIRRATEKLREQQKLLPERPRPDSKSMDEQLQEALHQGWPGREAELGNWLDRVFAGEWVEDYEEAARLPLGMIFDPRSGGVPPRGSAFAGVNRHAAELLAARALQLQSRGDDGKALDQLLNLLGLSRQFRHLAASPALFETGSEAEQTALWSLDQWLQKVGPKRALLERALQGLNRHEAEVPAPVGSIKAAYVAARSRQTSYIDLGRMRPLLRQQARLVEIVPWENERNLRLLNAVFAGQLRLAELLAREQARSEAWQGRRCNDMYEQWGHYSGTDYLEGPGAELGARGWGRLLLDSFYAQYLYYPRYRTQDLIAAVAHSRCCIRGSQLQVALLLYQNEHGHLPETLQQLVPQYLAQLPPDPYTGQPFHFEISKGGEIPLHQLGDERAQGSRQVMTGQGVLWCTGPRVFVVPPPAH